MKQTITAFLAAMMCMAGMNVWALEPNGEGVYEIGSAEDLVAFSELVNAGNYTANAVLTADIDMSSVENFTPIAVTNANGTAYQATFDGQGHTISNLTIHRDASNTGYVGLFSHVYYGTVKNLVVKTVNITTDSETPIATGAVMGRNGASKMINVAAIDVTFNLAAEGNDSKTSHGGLSGAAANSANTLVENCYTNYPSMGYVGAKAVCNNCYVGDEVTAMAASGELCYKLNGDQSNIVWFQKIGTDPYPTLDSSRGTVFMTGETAYSNTDMAIPAAVNGVYQIGSAKELCGFAEIVNGGEVEANAVLTADIDFSNYNTQIGVDPAWYMGTFDGQGHTIKLNLSFNGSNGDALFRNLGTTGTVTRLMTTGTITTNAKFAAGIAGWSKGTVSRCATTVKVISSIEGDGTHGGIVGVGQGNNFVLDCVSAMTIEGPNTNNCGGLVGWVEGKTCIENCLVINDFQLSTENNSATVARNFNNYISRCYGVYTASPFGDVTGAIQITADDVASGKACFLLNSDQSKIIWRQNIGGDDFPLPFGDHAQVYCSLNSNCDGTLAPQDKPGEAEEFYSNNQQGGVPAKHVLKAGFCSVCKAVSEIKTEHNYSTNNEGLVGYWDPYYVEKDVDGYYKVKTAEDMLWLSNTEPLGNEYFKCKLMNDIDYSEYGFWLNVSNWFSGVVDGQGYKLTISIPEVKDSWRSGITPALCGTVKNLWIDGQIIVNATGGASVCGQPHNAAALIENVLSTVKIISKVNGDGTHGGFVGRSNTQITLRNCIFAGSIVSAEGVTTHSCAGLVGYCSNPTFIDNCVVAATFDLGTTNGNTIARNPTNLRVTNRPIYYVNAYADVPSGAIQISADDLKSGAATYMLNGDQSKIEWTQQINADKYPMPFLGHGQVYAQPSWGYRCDAQPLGDVIYTNEFQQVVIPDHQFVDGFCTVCDKYKADYMTPNADGFYEISTPRQLAWFSHAVNDGEQGSLNATLKNDIDMGSEKYFRPIGSEKVPYTGHFDGNGNTISNLVVSMPALKGVGLIGTIAGPSVIENLTLDKTCSITGDGYCGLVGFSAQINGNVVLRNLGNEGSVKCLSSANAGGILGCSMGSNVQFTLENCYCTGAVDGPTENAQLCGWIGKDGVVKNCWSTSPVTNARAADNAFVARNSVTITNSYSTQAGGEGGIKLSEEQVKNGELAYLLNQGDIQNPVWRQSLGYDDNPIFDAAHGIVNKIDAAGYATQYIADSNVMIPEGVTAYTGFIDTPWIALRPLTNIIPAGEAVVLEGAQGYYSFIPVSVGATVEKNDLKGVAEPLTATGAEYVLAQKDGAIGFFQAEAGTTIPAGKAYIEYVGAAGVKGFALEGTGINKVEATTDSETIFDLSGRRVEKAEKGIYIMNGKKVLR